MLAKVRAFQYLLFAPTLFGVEARTSFDPFLRFKGEFTRFSNPEDDMVIPMPGETVGPMLGSKMNRDSVGSVPPPPAPDFEPQSGNPFATPIGGDGPLPF